MENPLLFDGKKIGYRCYFVIASFEPMVAFFHKGYFKRVYQDFNLSDTDNLFSHIENFHVQSQDEMRF
jgi:hypothetical protein